MPGGPGTFQLSGRPPTEPSLNMLAEGHELPNSFLCYGPRLKPCRRPVRLGQLLHGSLTLADRRQRDPRAQLDLGALERHAGVRHRLAKLSSLEPQWERGC